MWNMKKLTGMAMALVLGLSLSYIPLKRIGYSLLTVVLSGQIIGWIQNIRFPGKNGRLS